MDSFVTASTQEEDAIALVRCFRQQRVLVIGDAMLDTYFEGSAARLCSEGPVPVVHKTAEYRLPGGAANTAANLRALDAEVFFLGLVGADLTASVLRSTLQERGIADRWLVVDEQGTTLHKLRILADGQYVVRFDEGGVFKAEQSQTQLLSHLETLYPQCDLVLLSDYRYGVLSEALVQRLAELHARAPKLIVADSKALQRLHTLPLTVVTPNYAEARLLVDGISTTSSTLELADVERVAEGLLKLLRTEHVALTLGSQGVFLLDRAGKGLHLPAHPVANANDVGAGDSFAAAMALALAAGATLQKAAQIGLDAASIAVTRRWTAVVQHQELLQRVSLRAHTHQTQLAQESVQRLITLLEPERRQGRSIVFTNGVFDILHAGHVQFLRQAKALGDILVVGLNSDEGVRRLKGNGRPITNERDRMALVAALDMVDHVLLFDEETPEQLIRVLRPAIHVKGGDYADESLPEAEAVQAGGGRIVILPLAGSMSTTRVIERIAALVSDQAEQHIQRGKA